MKSIVAVAVILVALSSQAFAACGGGGWTKPKVSDNDNSPSHHTTDTSVVSTPSTVVHTEPARTTTVVSTPSSITTTTAPVVSAPVTFDSSHKAFDTAQFDAVSAKLGLTEDQWKNVQKAKNDINDDLNKLIKNQRKAEHKYATCDGDCSSEYNKLNRTTEALKSYDATHEFERRLAEILQPSQLQTYESDAKEKVSAAKKS